MKGVSTVIATILMLMITIGLAGVAASYMMGWFGSHTATTIELDQIATGCTGTNITVYVKNTGTEPLTADRITISGTKADGDPISSTFCGAPTTTLTPGGGAVSCSLVTGSVGTNTIVVSGPSNTVKTSVNCAG